MKVFGLFYGGTSYGVSDIESVEEFPSIAAAVDTLAYRYAGHDSHYPAVSDEACMDLYFEDPRTSEDGDHYPDRRYEIGPRGGVRRNF